MPSSRSLLVVGLALVALAIAAPSSAETPSPGKVTPIAAAPAEPAAVPVDTVTPAPPRDPWMREVRVALDREREQIAGLRVRLQQKPDHQAALALQREIEKVKLDTEVAILRIQADAARKAGHAALAERLEVAAKDLLTPPAVTTLATRPAPRATGR